MEYINYVKQAPVQGVTGLWGGTQGALTSSSGVVDNGGSSDFAGSGADDYIQQSSTVSGYALGTGDFTLECWIKTSTTGSDGFYRRVYLQDATQPNYTGHLQLAITPNSGGGYANPWDDGTLDIVGNTVVTDGQWHHLAVCRDSTNTRLYVDGSDDGDSQSWTANINGQQPRIGSQNGSGGFDGLISNVRVVKGSALYTSNFTPPTSKLEEVSGSGYSTILLALQSTTSPTDNEVPSSNWTKSGDVNAGTDNPFD